MRGPVLRVLKCLSVVGLALGLLLLGWLSVLASQANIDHLSPPARPRYTEGVQGTACGLDQYDGASEVAYIWNSAGELVSANQTVNGQYSATLSAGVYTVYIKSTLPAFPLSGNYLDATNPDENWSAQGYWKAGSSGGTANMNPVFRLDDSYPPDEDWKVAEATAHLFKANDYTEPTTRVRRILHTWSTANSNWNRANQSPWWYWGDPGASEIGVDVSTSYHEFTGTLGQSLGWRDIDVTSDVQGWFNDGGTDYGWQMQHVNGGNAQPWYVGNNYTTDTSLRPYVSMVFTATGAPGEGALWMPGKNYSMKKTFTVTTGMQTVNFGVLDCGYVHIEPALGDPDYFFPFVGYTENFGTGMSVAFTGTYGAVDVFNSHHSTWFYGWAEDPLGFDKVGDAIALPLIHGGGCKSEAWPEGYTCPYNINNLPNCPSLGDGAVTLLFNEPDNDFPGGSGWSFNPPLSYDRQGQINYAVTWTHKLLTQCGFTNRRWATPALVRAEDGGEGSRLDWLDDWWDTYVYSFTNNPKDDGVEYMAVHCYEFTPTGGSPETGKCADLWMPNAITWANNHGLRGVLVTEWGAPYTSSLTTRLTETVNLGDWLIDQEGIVGHAWFSNRNSGQFAGASSFNWTPGLFSSPTATTTQATCLPTAYCDWYDGQPNNYGCFCYWNRPYTPTGTITPFGAWYQDLP